MTTNPDAPRKEPAVSDLDTSPGSPYALGWAAWRRPDSDIFAIKDPALLALMAATERPDVDAMCRAWYAGRDAANAAGEPRTDPPLPKPRPRLTITHTSADGTLLEGSVKGDGAWEAIRAAQDKYRFGGKFWRYFPSLRMVGIVQSRDRAPRLRLMHAAAQVLRDAGFDVEVTVDGTPRAMEESEGARAERMDERAENLAERAARLQREADARFAAGQEIADAIPAGQPILRGHHSERGHRRALDRMEGHRRASVELTEKAEHAEDGAESAARHMEARENPRRVYRRIRTQEADLRDVERKLAKCRISGRNLKADGEGRTLTCPVCYAEVPGQPGLKFPDHGAATGLYAEEMTGRKAHLEESIRYWREALDAARAAGADVPPDASAIKKGDWIKVSGHWREVTRVNRVSVSVRDTWDRSDIPEADRKWFSRTVPLDNIGTIRATSPYAPAPAAEDVQDLDAVTEVTA